MGKLQFVIFWDLLFFKYQKKWLPLIENGRLNLPFSLIYLDFSLYCFEYILDFIDIQANLLFYCGYFHYSITLLCHWRIMSLWIFPLRHFERFYHVIPNEMRNLSHSSIRFFEAPPLWMTKRNEYPLNDNNAVISNLSCHSERSEESILYL